MTAQGCSAHEDAKARRLILFALAGAVFAGAASMRILDAQLPKIADFYGQSIGTVGFTVTAYSASYSFCQLFYGPLSDRLGPYRIVTSAAMLSGLAALGCAIAPTIDWLVLLRLLAGGVAAAIGPLAFTWASQTTSLELRPVAVANLTGASIFGATAGQLGGGVIGQIFNWQASFILVAALFGTTGLILGWAGATRPHLRFLGRKPVAEHQPSGAVFRALLGRPAVRITLMAVGVEGLATYMTFTYVSVLLGGRLTIDVATVGLLMALFGLGGVAFVLAARRLVTLIAESGRAVLGGSLMGSGFLLMIIIRSPPTAGCALFILGLGFFMFHNILQVRATKMAPDAPGAAISLFAATFFLSQAIGTMIGGWSFDHFGGSISCGASAVILTGLGIVMGRIIGLQPRPASNLDGL